MYMVQAPAVSRKKKLSFQVAWNAHYDISSVLAALTTAIKNIPNSPKMLEWRQSDLSFTGVKSLKAVEPSGGII